MSTATTDSLVDVPGGRIFVRTFGAGRADPPPILLLHDSLGSVEQWREFPSALAQVTGRAVVAYDRLGFGHSTARTGRPSLDFIREEAEVCFPALRRALGMPRLVLFGHSVGGAMALVIAALHGEACVAVITEAAQAFVEPRTVAGIRSAKAEFDDPAQFARLARWHGEKARWVLDAWTETWLAPEFQSWSLDAYLGEVTCPVLAIHGDSDDYGSLEFPRRIVRGVAGRAELAVL
jgi:pimeloyl-ACP methyl ester carboxylesterase